MAGWIVPTRVRDMTDETAAFQDIAAINAAASVSTPGQARRAQHAKHHGCVSATFTIRDDVPEQLRLGLFQPGTRYAARIRLSNGGKADDRRGDAHGMAIKLSGVPGRKLLEGEETQSAQDFVLVDNETFFTGDLDAYVKVNHGVLQPGKSLADWLAFGFWALQHIPLFVRIFRFANRRPTSPLTLTYFSTLPCSIGDRPVKWIAQPVSTRPTQPLAGPDGLAEALRRDLADEPFAYDFGADVQTDPARQPVEDPTIAWSTAGARRVWLARIEIACQVVEPHTALAENIAFSPWHGLVEHRPLGAINRARGYVYRKLSVRRHELNGVEPADTSEVPIE